MVARAGPRGGMVDTGDLKSLGRKAVPVRVRPRAPYNLFKMLLCKDIFEFFKFLSPQLSTLCALPIAVKPPKAESHDPQT